MSIFSRSRRWWLAGVVLALLSAGAFALLRRGGAPNLTTAPVTRGDFIDVVEVRGTVRPLRSIMITAPMQSGELQILTIAKNGSAIKAGDVAVEFDGSTLRRTIQEKQSELRQAEAEFDQTKARANISQGEDRTALVRTQYDVERAKLDVGGTQKKEIVSRVDAERAKLALADAEQRQKEAEIKDDSNRKSTATGFTAQERRLAKIRADLARAQAGLEQLQARAPADGIVNIMPNWRTQSGMQGAQEFKPGDSVWPGAEIVELPDLSSVHLEARIDESDRGRLRPGQSATIRVDAIADHEFQAVVSTVSVLARVDFSSWPPVKNFDLKLNFKDADGRLRPGMSAATRIAVGRLSDMLLVPGDAVFIVEGRPVVYRLQGRQFVEVVVEIVKRSKEQVAVKGPLTPSDRVALTKPAEDRRRAAK